MSDVFDAPTSGHNKPPTGSELSQLPMMGADELAERLPDYFNVLAADVADALAQAKAEMPETVSSDDDNAIVAKHIKAMRESVKRVEAHHAAEKAPYLASGRAVDQFFFGMRDRLAKARDIIQRRGDEFTARKAAAERLRRQQEAQAAADAARREREERERLEREAAEIAAAAARARKPENIEKLEAAAQQTGAQAQLQAINEMVAVSEAENAVAATTATTADMTRTRFEDGNLASGKQVGFATVTDYALVDLNALRPYIKRDIIDKAVAALAKQMNFEGEIAGVSMGWRDKGVYR
jgi:hypothetical protein